MVRNRRKIGIGVVVAAALTIIILGDLTPGEPIPAVDCPFDPGDIGARVTCFQIPVGSGSILATVLHRGSEPLRSAPVLVLGEEPGTTPSFDLERHASMAMLADRDLVLVDPLGSSRTAPVLDCDGLDLSRLDSLTLCRDRMADAGALEGHATLDQVEHLIIVRDQLRRGRPWRAWHVVGRGYGAQLAQQLAAADRRGIDSMVLSAAAPVTVPSFVARAQAYPSAIAALDADCSSRVGCGGLPSIEMTTERVAHRLTTTAEPIEVVGADGERTLVEVDDAAFVASVSHGLQTPSIPGMLPWTVARIDEQASEFGLGRGARDALAGLVSATADRPAVDTLLWWNTVCSEQIQHVATEVLAELENDSGGLLAPLDPTAVCSGWPAAETTLEPVEVETPILLLDGITDPIGTHTWTERVATTMTDASILPVSQAEWMPGSSTCSASRIGAFFDDPRQNRDSGCLSESIEFRSLPVPVGDVRQIGRSGETAAMALGSVALIVTLGATAWIWLGSPDGWGRRLWIGVGLASVMAFLGSISVLVLASSPASLIAQPAWTWVFFGLPWVIPPGVAVATWASVRDVAAKRVGRPWPARFALLAVGVGAILVAMALLDVVPGI